MLNIIKEKLEISPDLKKKINWAKNYTSTSITIEEGALIKLKPPNLISEAAFEQALKHINQQNEETAEEFYKMNSNSKKDDYQL